LTDNIVTRKVINTVTKLLDLLEDQGVLLEPAEGSHDNQVLPRLTDDRSMVVREILDSERKYVQDLEVLQVRSNRVWTGYRRH
jgi:cell division control protein 24